MFLPPSVMPVFFFFFLAKLISRKREIRSTKENKNKTCRHCRSLRRQYQIPVQGRFACKVSRRNLGGDGSVEKGRLAKKETACSNMRMPLPPRFPAAQRVLPLSSLTPTAGNSGIRVVESTRERKTPRRGGLPSRIPSAHPKIDL